MDVRETQALDTLRVEDPDFTLPVIAPENGVDFVDVIRKHGLDLNVVNNIFILLKSCQPLQPQKFTVEETRLVENGEVSVEWNGLYWSKAVLSNLSNNPEAIDRFLQDHNEILGDLAFRLALLIRLIELTPQGTPSSFINEIRTQGESTIMRILQYFTANSLPASLLSFIKPQYLRALTNDIYGLIENFKQG